MQIDPKLINTPLSPRGSATAAKTILDTICRHILDELRVPYSSRLTLLQLYKVTASYLELSPEQDHEGLVVQIMAQCQNTKPVVQSDGALATPDRQPADTAQRTSPAGNTLVRQAAALANSLMAIHLDRKNKRRFR